MATRTRITRDELARMASSRDFIHRLTRDDLSDIVTLLDDREANETRSVAEQTDAAYDLAGDIRSAAGTLMARADALSSLLERNQRNGHGN